MENGLRGVLHINATKSQYSTYAALQQQQQQQQKEIEMETKL